MTTTLDPQFLRATILMTSFKGNDMVRAQACLLLIGLRGLDFTAADLPADVTNGSRHLAGAACGALIAQGLIDVVGREKSPNPDAKGRKVDTLRIPSNKAETARTWLRAHGVEPTERQAELPLSA